MTDNNSKSNDINDVAKDEKHANNTTATSHAKSGKCCGKHKKSSKKCCSDKHQTNDYGNDFQNFSKRMRPNIDEEDEFDGGNEKPKASLTKDEKIINNLQVELEKITKNADENKDLALRAKAELENVRRRAKLDVETAHKFSVGKFAEEMLHVFDSLERGMQAYENDEVATDKDAMFEGMKLTYKLFLDSLEKFGISLIDPLGDIFDPKKHEALSMQENSEATPNEVLMVVQKGFMQYDRVLRHAKVIIAKA